jgi:hypothetical protein
MKSPKAVVARLRQALANVLRMDERFDEVRMNQGVILSTLNANKTSRSLRDYEFKVFSQWGEDGIIQHLTRVIEVRNRTFIEFGVESFFESNCRFLLMKDDWRGFVMDGSKANIDRLRSSYFYWRHSLEALAVFITKENINELLAQSGFDADLGILSVDLDGNDYHILAAIEFFQPRILICEYNAVFGPTRRISVPYKADFYRTAAHHSNLYWGASLGALTYLADSKGYSLVGTNTAGNNAFFVRKDLVNSAVEVLTAEAAYRSSSYRESRNEQGDLTFAAADRRLDIIRGLPVIDVEKNMIESL